MIRIRVKSKHVIVRIDEGEKQRYVSAIQALHVVRVAIVQGGQRIEQTQKTRDALRRLVLHARDELDWAIEDVAGRNLR